jgi:hypothetical protein
LKIGENVEKKLANILKTMEKYFTEFLNAAFFSTLLFSREIPLVPDVIEYYRSCGWYCAMLLMYHLKPFDTTKISTLTF